MAVKINLKVLNQQDSIECCILEINHWEVKVFHLEINVTFEWMTIFGGDLTDPLYIRSQCQTLRKLKLFPLHPTPCSSDFEAVEHTYTFLVF